MKPKIKKQIRKILRLKIIEYYDNQGRFAIMSGLDEAIISKLINCYRDPTSNQEKLLSKLLKTPENQLFIKSDAN